MGWGVVGRGKGKEGGAGARYVFVRSNFGLDSDTNVNMLVSESPPKETDKWGLGHGAQPSGLTSSTVIGRGRVGGCGVRGEAANCMAPSWKAGERMGKDGAMAELRLR